MKLRALPTDGRAVTQWEDRDRVWKNVAEGIAKLLKQVTQKNDDSVGRGAPSLDQWKKLAEGLQFRL